MKWCIYDTQPCEIRIINFAIGEPETPDENQDRKTEKEPGSGERNKGHQNRHDENPECEFSTHDIIHGHKTQCVNCVYCIHVI